MVRTGLAELDELWRIIDAGRGRFDVRELGTVNDGDFHYPLIALAIGNNNPDAPAIGFFGGVHGLERIGARVLLAYLADLAERLGRDPAVERMLAETRLVFIPW